MQSGIFERQSEQAAEMSEIAHRAMILLDRKPQLSVTKAVAVAEREASSKLVSKPLYIALGSLLVLSCVLALFAHPLLTITFGGSVLLLFRFLVKTAK
jgi:hypothetical protein